MGEGIMMLLALAAALVGIIYFWNVLFSCLKRLLPDKPGIQEKAWRLHERLQRGAPEEDLSFEERLRNDVDAQLRR